MLSSVLSGGLSLTRLSATYWSVGGLQHPPPEPNLLRRKGLVRSLAFGVLSALLGTASLQAQPLSDNPTDAAGYTLTLPSLVNSGTAVPTVTTCTGTTNGSTVGLTLAGATNTPTTLVPAPPCGTFLPTTRDVWVRIDMPATGDLRYRITVSGGTAPALANGAMAAYTAPTASGPFTLLDCVVGGNPAAGQFTNPSLEVSCVAPGSKIYLRIWDEAAAASSANFTVCVQRQNFTTAPIATVYDTPCTAALLTATAQNLHNTFACTEGLIPDPSCGGYRGGDIWARYTVPANGAVEVFAAPAGGPSRIGLAVYTATNCASPNTFNEVACVPMTLAASELSTGIIRCLPPGSTIYVRAFAGQDAQTVPPRFGLFRLRATDGTGAAPTATNSRPCNAISIPISASCPTYTSGTIGFNVGACPTQGVPAPGCGTIGLNTPDVWYSFVAPANGTVNIRVNGDNSGVPAFDPAAALYTTGNASCSGPLTLVDCDNSHGVGLGANMVATNLVPGDTYYLRVWGEGTSGTQAGIFYICLTSPVPPAGECFYLIRMTFAGTTGSQTMRVVIGNDTTDYVTSNDPSQVFLVPVPSGVPVTFIYYNTGLSGTWGAGGYTYSVTRFGEGTPLWIQSGGVPVAGPTPAPTSLYTVATSCTPIVDVREDCLGSTTICGPTPVFSNTLGNTGSVVDLNASNRGCLQDENNGGTWFLFRANADGQVSFWLQGTTATTDDLDFAVWDAGSTVYAPTMPNVTRDICSPNGPPIRCSSARTSGRTGLDPGYPNRTTEGPSGFGWLSPLEVEADHIYILYVANTQQSTTRNFQLQWSQLVNDAGVPDNTILDCTQIILPVEMLFIRADAGASSVDVTWATATERNSDHFLVERSSNAVDFVPIGKVDAAGFSSLRIDYTFTDKAPLPGLNFYRLRQVDMDGTTTWSDVVAALFIIELDGLKAHPNPAQDALLIVADVAASGSLQLSIHDALGRVVLGRSLSAEAGPFRHQLDVSMLPSGTYTLRLTGGSEQGMDHVRFVKL